MNRSRHHQHWSFHTKQCEKVIYMSKLTYPQKMKAIEYTLKLCVSVFHFVSHFECKTDGVYNSVCLSICDYFSISVCYPSERSGDLIDGTKYHSEELFKQTLGLMIKEFFL